MRITRAYLRKLTANLNEALGRPSESYAVGHINLDFVSCYGGYALREIASEHGAEDFYWPRWYRVSAREIAAFLEGQLDMFEKFKQS